MDDERIIQVIQQFLKEKGYISSLQALEKETGQVFSEEGLDRGSELLNILSEWVDMDLARQTYTLDLERQEVIDELRVPGSGVFASQQLASLDKLHRGNILAVRLYGDAGRTMLATGSADRSVVVSDVTAVVDAACGPSGVMMQAAVPISNAAVLSVDVHPIHRRVLACSSMDGSVHLVDSQSSRVLQSWHDHTKYAVRVRFSSDGVLLASASYDSTVIVYRGSVSEAELEGENAAAPYYTAVHNFTFNAAVESLDFIPETSMLVVGTRQDNHLHYIDLTTANVSKVNMNANGDNHVSFTAMDIAAAASSNLVLVNTDKSRIIVFHIATAVQVRNLYGATNDAYSHPRAVWSPSSKYVFGTSQDNAVYVWDLATQRVAATLTGHTALVKELHHHSSRDLLATCSYDKTVRLWSSSSFNPMSS